MIVELTDSNFDEIVLKSTLPVMIHFSSDWSRDCRIIAPVVERLSAEHKDMAMVCKLDVGDNPIVSSKFDIRILPTILFLINGEVRDKQVGAAPIMVLETKLKELFFL